MTWNAISHKAVADYSFGWWMRTWRQWHNQADVSNHFSFLCFNWGILPRFKRSIKWWWLGHRIGAGHRPEAEAAPLQNDVQHGAAGRAGKSLRTFPVPRRLHSRGTGPENATHRSQSSGIQSGSLQLTSPCQLTQVTSHQPAWNISLT